VAECIFCAIAAGEAPATVVDQDEHTVAFMDINPWHPGHALVVPRRHSESLLEVGEEDLGHAFAAAQRLAARMRERLGCERVILWNSCGAAAGQVVMHFHIHVIPAESEGPELPRLPDASPAEIDAAAAALRNGA